MQDMKADITFHETMLGSFAIGETDPQVGATQGKVAGTTLSASYIITISDVDHFIADPDHSGNATGKVSFAPLGENIPANSGVFNLFSPTSDPSLKLMIYEVAFTQGGHDYYLAGRKEVRQESVLDLWRDTTTLYTLLHQGTDKSGPVVGAGILTIDLERFMKLISSIRVTNAPATIDQAKTLLRFGRFFLGELWDTYGLKASRE